MWSNYRTFVSDIITAGDPVPSRYGSTRELTNTTFRYPAGFFPERPRLNPKIGVVEGLFMLGGFFDIDAIKSAAPNADHALFTAGGAYGPRIRTQLFRMVHNFAGDPTSRQHVLHIAGNGDQYNKDTPCTLALQFLNRNRRLDCTAYMRSSDAIWGLPTDVIQFGVLTVVLARILSLVPGYVTVVAGSSHVYERTAEFAPVDDDSGLVDVPYPDVSDPDPCVNLERVRVWARAEAHNHRAWTPDSDGIALLRRVDLRGGGSEVADTC